MSILVKGVKMPRCCEVCPFNYDYYRCEALGDKFDDREEIDMETQRLPDCPLVEMPSRADVVEVVRCKDCKYLKPFTSQYGSGQFCECPCSFGGQGIKKPDDYCSYGERRDDREYNNSILNARKGEE